MPLIPEQGYVLQMRAVRVLHCVKSPGKTRTSGTRGTQENELVFVNGTRRTSMLEENHRVRKGGESGYGEGEKVRVARFNNKQTLGTHVILLEMCFIENCQASWSLAHSSLVFDVRWETVGRTGRRHRSSWDSRSTELEGHYRRISGD